MQLYCARLQHQISTTTVCWALCCLLGASAVIADTLPSAGSLQQNIQTGRGLNKPAMPPTSNLPPLLPKQIARGGPTLTVSQFRWVGNSLFSNHDLDRLTAASLGQTMDFAQLEMVAVAIANHYRAAGYVVQTRLPAQDIVNGVVTIEITEATFGKVRLDGPNSKREKKGMPLMCQWLPVLSSFISIIHLLCSNTPRGSTYSRNTVVFRTRMVLLDGGFTTTNGCPSIFSGNCPSNPMAMRNAKKGYISCLGMPPSRLLTVISMAMGFCLSLCGLRCRQTTLLRIGVDGKDYPSETCTNIGVSQTIWPARFGGVIALVARLRLWPSLAA